METVQESSPVEVPAPGGPSEPQVDLTEDFRQQLEDIISTYQTAEDNGEPEDTDGKDSGGPKDQRLEKKMLKSLGEFSVLCVWVPSCELAQKYMNKYAQTWID